MQITLFIARGHARFINNLRDMAGYMVNNEMQTSIILELQINAHIPGRWSDFINKDYYKRSTEFAFTDFN